MKSFLKKHRRGFVTLACLTIGILAIGSGWALMASNRQSSSANAPEEIVLVARDVSFFLADRPNEPNPRLVLKKGVPVNLVLRNEEPEKVLHCFTIGGLEVHTSRDLATGESETLNFTPSQTGTFAYACLMHPMMTGTVIVQ